MRDQMTEEEWGKMNLRRGDLIHKYLQGTLTEAETAEYNHLQKQSLEIVVSKFGKLFDKFNEDQTEILIGKRSPEEVFGEFWAVPVERRPEVFYLDAREASIEDTRAWIVKFDTLICEKEQKPDPFQLQVVVFLSTKQSLKTFEDLLSYSDIDWVLTDDCSSSLAKLYSETVNKDLASLSGDPTKGLDLGDDPNAHPIENFISEDQREDWKQRLRDLGCKDV